MRTWGLIQCGIRSLFAETNRTPLIMDTGSNFGVLADCSYTPCSMSSSGRPLTRRACNECRRKKTRCDMRHPKCSLCSNVGSNCTYRGEHRQRLRRHSAAAITPSTDTLESAEKVFNASTPASSDGIILLDDIDLILRNIENGDDRNDFLEPMSGLGSCGTVRWLNASSLSQGYWPNEIQLSPIQSEINADGRCFIPADLASELIDLYFEKVQGICPLFMREKFYKDYFSGAAYAERRIFRSSPVDEFVLNGVFALAARYSSSSKLASVDPHCRDRQFVKRATDLWELIQKDWSASVRTLKVLQGLILLTFSHIQSGPSETAWTLTGSCVRLAYDLDLHTIDAENACSNFMSDQDMVQDNWASLEEKRRAWWTVWEMDTFSSSISFRPFGVDSRVVRVLLPVSDQDWANNTQVRSATLGPSEMPWHGIDLSSNKCERAWFLVCLAVLRRTVDSILSGASIAELQVVEDTIGCAFLALPPSFHDLPLSKVLWQSDVVANNWMVCSLIALNWYGTESRFCYFMQLTPSESRARSRINLEFYQRLGTTGSMGSSNGVPKPVEICRSIVIDVHHLTRLLSPQALSVCSPLIFCAVVGLGSGSATENTPGFSEIRFSAFHAEHTKLVLSSVGRHWSIGRALLGMY